MHPPLVSRSFHVSQKMILFKDFIICASLCVRSFNQMNDCQESFKMEISKILSETTMRRAFINGFKHHLLIHNQSCSNYATGVKIGPPYWPFGHTYTLNYIGHSSDNFFSETTWSVNSIKLYRNDYCVTL